MADKEIRIDRGRPEDVEDLAEALRGQFPDITVTIVPPAMSGYGVTAWEVLNVFVPWSELPHDAFMAGVGIVAKEAIAWAHRRLKKSPHRPKYVAIYGPNGEIVKAVRVDPGGEEIDMTEEQREEQARFAKIKPE
jgi:hypothetical protein